MTGLIYYFSVGFLVCLHLKIFILCFNTNIINHSFEGVNSRLPKSMQSKRILLPSSKEMLDYPLKVVFLSQFCYLILSIYY